MICLTFFGGIGEIGGNKILLETSSGNVLLDFGRRMGVTGSFYSEFLQVRSKNALRDLLRLGVLPRIDGIYDKQYLDATTLLENPLDAAKIPLAEARDYWIEKEVKPFNPSATRVNTLFVSHAHFDHIQDVSFLDPSISIMRARRLEYAFEALYTG